MTAIPVTIVPPFRPSFAVQAEQSLLVEVIAKALFDAALCDARLEDQVWDRVSTQTQEIFRRHAEIALLRVNAIVDICARATVRLSFGEKAEAAIDAYHAELLKVAGGRS